MQDIEITKMEELLSSDSVARVLEYGSGYSTLCYSKFVDEWDTVEHDLGWARKITTEASDNVTVYHVPQNLPRIQPTTKEQFENYVEFIHDLDHPYDLYLIDGRARCFCLYELLKYDIKDSIVLIHDFDVEDRPHYNWILDHYNMVWVVGTLACLEPKE